MNASNRWIMCRGDGFLREAHSYEYDNNGNILYVNTSRVKHDMTTQPDVQRTREERFRWDEENRLTALSQNGYVSHYWYDADGERDKRTVPVSQEPHTLDKNTRLWVLQQI